MAWKVEDVQDNLYWNVSEIVIIIIVKVLKLETVLNFSGVGKKNLFNMISGRQGLGVPIF